MNTTLPSLTTGQLLEACASQGVAVSITQLGRWVREGLIPASLRQRHGRGRGMGTEWLWEPESIQRIVLIARTLAAGDPSLLRAAIALAETGYAPEAERLRMVLLDRLAAYEQLMTKRQKYLTEDHSQVEKHRRLKKHMRRKIADMPDATFQPFAAHIGALLGVVTPDDLHTTDEVTLFQQFFSIPALYERLETIDGAVLLEKYEEAGYMLPSLVPLLLTWINLFIFPLLIRQLQKTGRDSSLIPTSIDSTVILNDIWTEGDRIVTSNPMIGEFRLFLTVIPAENTALLTQWYKMLRQLISQILNYMGIPSEQIDSFFSEEAVGR